MKQPTIQVDHIWKKFRKGEFNESLRGTVGGLVRRIRGRGPRFDQLGDKEFWALRDVSFRAGRGESLAIIGPNGAGKSTMLKLLSRILKPNMGTYKVHGRLSALIEVGAGFHNELTGRENIYLSGTILGMARKEIRSKEGQIIEFAGVEEFIDTPVKRYSSGMKARLGFAVAAHMEPDVLLVDEVLSVGDVRFRRKCLDHMEKMIKTDVTVIFISHMIDQVRRMCPNSVVLHHGEVVYNGPTDGAVDKYMEVLGEEYQAAVADEPTTAAAEIKNIRLCDEDGDKIVGWTVGQPAMVHFDFVVNQPLPQPVVIMKFYTARGIFLGSATTARESIFRLPSEPGVHGVRFTMDPMILSDGEFEIEFQINCRAKGKPAQMLWRNRTRFPFSVRGNNTFGAPVMCQGQWALGPACPISQTKSA